MSGESCEESGAGRPSVVRRLAFRSGPPQKSLALRLWELLQPLARLWGIITSIVMSGAGAELMVLGSSVAPGLIAGAVCVLILETMWVAALFVDVLCRRGEYTLSLRCWDFFRWSCGRARAPMYACGATALLFAQLSLLATISGGLLLGLAALRAAVPFSPFATHGPHSPRAGSSLLSQLDSPMPDVFYNAANSVEERSEEMTVLDSKTQERPRSTTPKPPLLEL
uniref:Putative odorant receptor 14 n=1 Tax=Conopomorpha sinensis TaxID=940481 RepID=A0A3S7SGQ7_9NEOP|nr:putative odorant receptor 14 [Conopomorpha sinensis]